MGFIVINNFLKLPISKRVAVGDELRRGMFKGVIAFDLDGIVWLELGDRTDLDQLKELHTDCLFLDFQWSIKCYSHCCPPYFDVLLNYLIDSGYRVVFFSAGGQDRNELIVPQLLTNLFGVRRYEQLKSFGQFEIFSSNHLRVGYRMFAEHTCIKDLSVVLTDDEDIDNAVLVEDQCIYAAYNQQPCILGLDLHKWDITTSSDETYMSFAKNNNYYLLGIFDTYFNSKLSQNTPLRAGIKRFYLENLSLEQQAQIDFFKETYYPNREHNFVMNMINNGLKLVKKTYPEAKIYGFYKPDCIVSVSVSVSDPINIPRQFSSCDLSMYSEEVESSGSAKSIKSSESSESSESNDSSNGSVEPVIFKLTPSP